MRFCLIAVTLSLLLSLAPVTPAQASVATPAVPDGPLDLSNYPRPAGDNGLGVHWGTRVYGQPDATVDYFVQELVSMDVHWVKFLNDGTEGRQNDYLVRQLTAHHIMPVTRIYMRCNKAVDLESLRRMVEHYRPLGLYYYELYNEPELPGVEGGWCNGEEPDPDRLLDIWIPAARVIEEAGGYPAIPSIFPPSLKDPDWQNSFFMRFLAGLKDRGETPLLYRSWGAVHNYFLNHPVDYPYDNTNRTGTPLSQQEISDLGLTPAQVDAINQARAIARRPRSQGGYYVGDNIDDDSSCFLMFQAYRNRFFDLFGFEIPLISTEGGATVGSSEDPRYPALTPALMADRTIQAYEYMLNQAPPYYFAFTSWLIADGALGNFGSAWESWAWYRNMDGDHLPVVDRLKAHPRRADGRLGVNATASATATWNARPTATAIQSARSAPTATPTVRPASSATQPAQWAMPLGRPTAIARPTATPAPAMSPSPAPSVVPASSDLGRFPRPPADNGWGIHWVPTLFGQSTDVVDRFVDEAAGMGIKWVKVMQPDESKVEHEYLLRSLAQHDMMPVLRVYKPYNTPYEHLDALARSARGQGVYYFELYNEPNISGAPGGWKDGQAIDLDTLVANWLPAAKQVIAAGGFPSIPAPAPGGDYEDTAFLRAFLRKVVSLGEQKTLSSSWVALHNYFLNHPLDYPEDAVNLRSVPLSQEEISRRKLSDVEAQAINQARANSRLPRAQGGYHVGDTIDEDSNGFRKFEAYEKVVREETGTVLPMISTEGGAMPGTQEDPRYPKVSDEDVAERTVEAFTYMLDKAPDYYFAVTPWLIANVAAGNPDGQWESATWFRGGAGEPMPVVAAVKELASKNRQRNQSPAPSASPSPTPANTPKASTSRTGQTNADTDQGWLIVWRDNQVFNCTPVQLSAAQPAVRAWKPPVDTHAWGMEIRDGQGRQMAAIGRPGAMQTGLPASCGPWPVIPQRTATAAPPTTNASNKLSRQWDARLDQLGVKLIEAPAVAGMPAWRLVSARYEDATQAGGRHHIYVQLLDENGRDTSGNVTISWSEGRQTLQVQPHTGSGDAYDRYGANFPMYGPLGSYRVSVDGASDTLAGAGMPGKQHVNYILVFQRTRNS